MKKTDVDFNPPFSFDIVKKYFSYRIKEFSCTDHGIASGCEIYKKLKELLEEAKQNGLKEENGDYHYNGLKWNDSQINTFKKIASNNR